jgi:hypothetical protein
MKTESVDIYEFNELSDLIKQDIFERYRTVLVSDTWWSDGTIDFWKEKLEESGFCEPEIHFSGFSSQGDGACFDARIDMKKIKLMDKFKDLDFDNLEISIETTNNHYSHSGCRKILVNYDISAKDEEIPIYEELQAHLEEKRIEFCDNIYKDLEKDYDYETSNIAINDFLEANEYEFTKEGKDIVR